MLDVDNFKSINDTYGHDVGDNVLRELTDTISEHIRQSDRFGRWGGEEFILLLPELDKEHALMFTEKLRKTIADHSFNGVSQITVSFGVAIFNQNDTKKSLLKRADTALYQAKDEGRNKVIFH